MIARRLACLLVATACAGASPRAWAAAEELNRFAARSSCLVEANSVIKLTSQSQGALAKVNVRRGDVIQANAIVAELESKVEEAMLKAARLRANTTAVIRAKAAELANAERKFGRQKQLAATQIASAQTLEQAETDVAVLRSQLIQAELDQQLAAVEVDRIVATIERRVMRSPVDGVIASVDHFPGEYADSSTAIASILEIQPLKIEVYLPLDAYPFVKVGMSAQVRPQGPFPGTYPAEVVTKDRQIDAASGLFQIQLRMPNPDLAVPAGLRCKVEF